MADILKVYTAEQLYEMYRNYIINNSDITDFNEGSVMRAIVESNAEIASQIQMDFKIAIFRAIAVALYEGFGFPRKEAIRSTGFLTVRRKPTFTIAYSGAGTSAKITVNATTLTVAVIGAPADALILDFATYPKTSDLVTEINDATNWTATLEKDVDSDTIFLYDAIEIKGQTDYSNNPGFDICLQSDAEITIPAQFSVTINNIVFSTISSGVLSAGSSKVALSAECAASGLAGNIRAEAIDTANGKGVINAVVDGLDNVINFSAFSGGQNQETDLMRQLRFKEAILSLNAGTARGILAEVKKIDGVINAGIRPNYPFKGMNTIVVDDGSGIISPELFSKVMKALDGDPNDLDNFPGKGIAGIDAVVVAPTIIPVNINLTVYRLSRVRVSLDEISLDVKTAVENYINTLQLGQPVLYSEIFKVAKNSNAGVYDVTLATTCPVPQELVSVTADQFARTGEGTGGTVNVTVVIAGA